MKQATAKEWSIVNKNKRFFDWQARTDVINISTANTRQHEITKCIICIELANRGHHFLTEAKGTYRGKEFRADIVDLTTARIYEVHHTETAEAAHAKGDYYPFPVYAIRAEDEAWGITRVREFLDGLEAK